MAEVEVSMSQDYVGMVSVITGMDGAHLVER